MFIERLRYLITININVLIIYDGYRRHISYTCLQILSYGNIEAYILISHTSGITKPLDVYVFHLGFSSMKNCTEN